MSEIEVVRWAPAKPAHTTVRFPDRSRAMKSVGDKLVRDTHSSHGFRVAEVALREAGEEGLPLRLLIAIVAYVGRIGADSAYQGLRARISHPSEYRAENVGRWSGVEVDGRNLDDQIWRMR